MAALKFKHCATVAACLALAAAAALAGSASAGSSYSCGYWRWAVKVARDADRWQIDAAPWATSISYLHGLGRPSYFGSSAQDHRIKFAEFHTWVIRRTRLIRYSLESDGDYHLVLRSPYTSQTMVTEIPAPSCSGGSRFYSSIARARGTFTRQFHGTFGYTNTTVDIRGVGFYDEEHNVYGQAPNGLELHPVTGLWFP